MVACNPDPAAERVAQPDWSGPTTATLVRRVTAQHRGLLMKPTVELLASYSASLVEMCGRPLYGRVLQDAFSDRWRDREAEPLQHQEEEAARSKAANDFDIAAVIAGEAAGLVSDVPPAAEVVSRIVRDATRLLARAGNRYSLA